MSEAPETKSIVIEYALSKPPARVWRALTEPALLARWLMENDIAPVVGRRFTMRARPAPGWDGVVRCEVLAVEPERLLRFSWRGGSDEVEGYGGALDTVVTFTLAPTPDGGTTLRLEHSGFTARNGFAFEMMGKGWRENVVPRMEPVLADAAVFSDATA